MILQGPQGDISPDKAFCKYAKHSAKSPGLFSNRPTPPWAVFIIYEAPLIYNHLPGFLSLSSVASSGIKPLFMVMPPLLSPCLSNINRAVSALLKLT